MKKEYIRLIAIILIILFILISFIIYNQLPLLIGKKIILATNPVDPFDPFRGQYMNINYEISTLENTQKFEINEKVYVILKEDEEGIFRMQDLSRNRPDEGFFIRGEVKRVYGDTMSIEYGIEQYFFEKSAKLPTINITIVAKVDNFGHAVLKEMLYNGKPLEIEYKEFEITS